MATTTRVLLVEDDPDIAQYVTAILKLSRGVVHEVEHVRSLGTGAARWEEGAFDVVLLDLGLPDSASPLATIRAVAEWDPEPCIVVLTSQAEPEFGLEAVRHGAHDFLLKSTITPPMLQRVIAYARERHQRRKRLLTSHSELTSQVTNLEAYVASVSHDLRSPLASASMLLQFMRDRHRDLAAEQLEEFLVRADAAIARGLQFADDLLHDARVGGESRTPLDLGQLARDAIELAGPPPTLAIELGPFPEGVWGRAAAMLQVLTNLVANASRYAQPGPCSIRVHGVDEGKHAKLLVDDNGPGVPADRRKEIFHAGESGERDRTGLGLSTVARQVALDGGRVWVEDSPELGGARFVVNIPLRSTRSALEGEGGDTTSEAAAAS